MLTTLYSIDNIPSKFKKCYSLLILLAFINAAFLCCHIVINEFAPVFAISQNQSFSVPSLLAEGWLVTTLTAIDMDIIDSNVTYNLEETGNYTFF